MTQLTREQAFLITSSLTLLAAIGASFALYWAQALAIPFVLSIGVAYLCAPIVDMAQTRMRAPRWLGILLAFLVIGTGGTVLVMLLYSSARGLSQNSELYLERLAAMGEWGMSQLDRVPPGWLPDDWNSDHFDSAAILREIDVRPILGELGTRATDLLSLLANLVSNATLVALFAVYLLAGQTPGQGDGSSTFASEVNDQIRKYIGTKFVMSAATGALTWLILAILGLDLALVFGVLAFLLNFIPSIGSFIAMLLPIPIALIQADSLFFVLLVVALPGAVQFTIGNVIEPKVMGDSLDLHPITVLLTLIFWGLLWGAVGMLLAVPLTGVVKIVANRFETTRPLSELLAGRITAVMPETADDAKAA